MTDSLVCFLVKTIKIEIKYYNTKKVIDNTPISL